ncbi:hypothetical protein F383_37518 [Gossypium arboreum]|uniref:Uncharacterized protein n=1 Tax=Gossypium arboreum TaxID=29729 RepID=A0A0B0MHF7_GOSAR|nr:hypothetical protein F383_37518 [Gossypium arboreum]
MRCRKGFSPDG